MKKLFAVAIAAVFLLSGCAVQSQSGDAYSRGEARNMMSVRMGTLEAARMVKLEGTHSGAGMIAGAAVGGIAGSSIGGGKGKKIATILGILAGAGAGAALEESSSSSQGLELIVRMDNGELIAVVQQLSNEGFSNGQRVRVLSNGRQVRVTGV